MAGGLVTKSIAGNILPGQFSAVINMDGQTQLEYSRLSGWIQYGADRDCFKNQDLHDQFERAVTGDGLRPGTCFFPDSAALTYMASVTSVDGVRRLLAGTRTALYASDDLEGSWRMIGYGFGGECPVSGTDRWCSSTRFRSATLGNYTLFVNGLNDVQAWLFDDAPVAPETKAVKNVGDLVALGITSVRQIISYQGFILLADFVEEGVIQRSTVLWSDYNDPLSYIPGGESIAGRYDFGKGEKILCWAELGTGVRIYTDKAVYHITLTGDDRVFAFTRVCGDMQPVTYPNSLVSTGDEHLWVGQDSIWLMAEYDRTPRRLDWLHEASGVIHVGVPSKLVGGLPAGNPVLAFGPINKSQCDQVVGVWDRIGERVIFSWPSGSAVCPDRSLMLWPRTQKASVVDYGFTAGVVHQPYLTKSLRRVMDDFRVCNANDGLAALEQEGCGGGQAPIDYPSLLNMERSSAYPMAPDSAIAAFCDFCVDSLCGVCDSTPVLLMASSADRTIKQWDPGNCSRQEFIGLTDATFPAVAAGCYETRSYTWLIQAGVSRMGSNHEQTIHDVSVGWSAAEDLPYQDIECQVGTGDQPSTLDWYDSDPLNLGPQDGGPSASSDWARSGNDPKFKFMATGYWLNWRLFGRGVGGCFSLGEVIINPKDCV